MEKGFRPIVLERGKNVRDRKKDLSLITKMQKVDPESNYCFGEGGAGAYSDGKLYTRSKKRGDIEKYSMSSASMVHLHQFSQTLIRI